jgi:hypothetical protein
VDIDPIPDLSAEITWSRRLLRKTRNVTLGTVNADDSAHLTVLTNGFVFAPNLHFYWWSFPDTNHSENIRRTGEAELLIYNSASSRNSLRLKVIARELESSEIPEALAILNRIRQRFRRSRWMPWLKLAKRQPEEFTGAYPKRLYMAEVAEVYVPVPRLSNGRHIGDTHALVQEEALRGFEAS